MHPHPPLDPPPRALVADTEGPGHVGDGLTPSITVMLAIMLNFDRSTTWYSEYPKRLLCSYLMWLKSIGLVFLVILNFVPQDS